ncbi:MAG: type III secretion system export apparatus subunit SctS [Gammaproteobacteria bacterium]
MTEEQIIHFASQSLLLILYLSLPVVLVATVVGLLVGLFQALTQIQDQTLAFGLKLVGVIIVMLFTARWMGHELLLFTDQMFLMISTVAH